MFNAMFMSSNTSAAGLVLTCGTDPRSNWWKLLQNGAPRALVQVGHSDTIEYRQFTNRVVRPCLSVCVSVCVCGG